MPRETKNTIACAFRAAFPLTLPVLAGYFFLGMSYGLYMHSLGFSWLWPTLTAAFVYGGSLEFVLGSMLCAQFNPLTTAVMAVAVQLRHTFYAITQLGRYRGNGWKTFFLVFGMSDETFAITSSTPAPEGVDEGWFMLLITWLDQLYWIVGSAAGGIFGQLVAFPTKGLSFVMTALFVVIFLGAWDKAQDRRPAYIGLVCSVVCLLVLGPSNFMVPAMACMTAALLVMRELDARAARAQAPEGGDAQ